MQEPWDRKGLNFVNPPYGRKIAPWIAKCASEAADGAEVILLGPARTDTKWFQRVLAPSSPQVLLWEGRLKFLGATNSALFPSFLAYWGSNPEKFVRAFAGKGWIV
ncbi:adenine methyltransferase [bacterium]|nr:adenine methyltransferase [bacterium]